MERAYDPRTGRPLIGGSDDPRGLTDDELQVELTIAAAGPRPQAHRLDVLLLELSRRSARRQPELPTR